MMYNNHSNIKLKLIQENIIYTYISDYIDYLINDQKVVQSDKIEILSDDDDIESASKRQKTS